jgi:hypothetical protein
MQIVKDVGDQLQLTTTRGYLNTSTLRIDRTAWFDSDEAEAVLLMDLLVGDAVTIELPEDWEGRDYIRCLSGLLGGGESETWPSDLKYLLALRILRHAGDAHLAGLERGGVIRAEAYALPDGNVGFLTRFEASGPPGILRFEFRPALSALASDWSREFGQIEEVYQGARLQDERVASQARAESLADMRKRFAARLLGELPFVACSTVFSSSPRLKELVQNPHDSAILQ